MATNNASSIEGQESNITMTTHSSNFSITTQGDFHLNTTFNSSDIYVNRTVTDSGLPWRHQGEGYELGTSVIVAIALGSAAFIIIVGG